MDKGKTTKILSGGAYIGKDGKRHEWSKIHGYKPKKTTDDNWMEYGMPADEETNESKNMNKKLIRLTESDLHRIVKESVKRVLKENTQLSTDYIWEKIQNVYDDAIKQAYSRYGNGNWKQTFISSLAWMMAENNLSVEDMKDYGNVLQIVNADKLAQEVESCKNYLEWEKRDEKRREYEAWAEEQMNDMGYDLNGEEL